MPLTRLSPFVSTIVRSASGLVAKKFVGANESTSSCVWNSTFARSLSSSPSISATVLIIQRDVIW